ncbi:hypothetical protein JCM8208_006953 [Rhodotorula glutinis]
MAEAPRRRADRQSSPSLSPRPASSSFHGSGPSLDSHSTEARQDTLREDYRSTAHGAGHAHAHRGPSSSTAPPPLPFRRSLAAGDPSSSPTSPSALQHHQQYSPRLAQSVGAAPRGAGSSMIDSSSRPFANSSSTRPVAATPPRTFTTSQSSLARDEVDSAARSPKSSSGSSSTRRRPAPLDFSREQVSPRSPNVELVSGPDADGRSSPPVLSEAISPRSRVPPRRTRAGDEERDSLSGLISFDPSSSPVIDTTIPSGALSLTDEFADGLGRGRARDDVPPKSGSSFLSSSMPASASARAPYQPSSVLSLSTYDGARQQHGLGLGLPFSMSAHAGLSSLAIPPTSAAFPAGAQSATESNPPSPAAASTSAYRSPLAGPRDPHRSSVQLSPAVDRGQLIGLGELATPRWTSGVLEKRWGAPASEDRRGSDETSLIYAVDPMPAIHAGTPLGQSPTVSRPGAVRQPFARAPSYDSPNRPFAQAGPTALHPPPVPLLPSSASSATIALDASPAALLNFAAASDHHSQHGFGPLDFSAAPLSAALSSYSFDQEPSASQQQQHDEATPGEADVPRRRSSSRRKSTASSSAPSSAGVGRTWTLGHAAAEGDMVGLGFDHDIASPTEPSRRISGGGSSSATVGGGGSAARKGARGMSLDGKTSAKQVRRQSSGKATFAHLPPSPAASNASHVFAAQLDSGDVPTVPPLAAFPSSPAAPPHVPPAPTSSTTTPGRTPDHARLSRHSFHSHHSSPSIVAASILRHTREVEGVDVDIERAAAVDEGTAAALAKLDGLSSPRMSRISSTTAPALGPGASEPRSRKTSRTAAGDLAASTSSRRDSSQSSAKRRVRTSTGDSSAATRDGDLSSAANSRTASRAASPVPPPPALPSPSLHAATKSLLSASSSSMPPTSTTSRVAAQNRLASSTQSAPVDVPFPASSSPFKRGSSSSATGTSVSAVGSHDSTSATSFATRSPASKYRRSSAGSDVSSIHSAGDGRPALDRNASAESVSRAGDIPPVPPLPKDWETYRPAASATATQGQGSPRVEASAAHGGHGLQAPPLTATRTTSSSSRSTAGESAVPVATTASGGSGRRKWSISSAFHKATRSPKAQQSPSMASSSGVKESTSFGDLQSAAGKRMRTTSFSQSNLPRRLAASTSNLSSMSDSSSMPPPALHGSSVHSAGSLGRNSLRGGAQVPPFLRQRTSSQSSSSTTRTAQRNGQGGDDTTTMAPPAVVTTSPGRSRSSLINPRRTPSSGIPFFSRKGSNSDVSATTPSPNPDAGEPFSTPSSSDKGGSGGRKSILGLNFLRSGGSKRDKEKGMLSPPSSARSTFSSSTSASSSPAAARQVEADEFGRRASLATPKRSGSLLRKRGKTLSSADQGDVFRAPEPVQLPPMQVHPLPPSTRRLDPLKTSGLKLSSAPSSSLNTPRTRTSRLQDSVKANLPTIAGSPSTHGLLGAGSSTSSSTDPSPSGTPPPKSQTPTRIPRLNARASPTSRSLIGKPGPRRVGSFSSGLDGQLSSSASSGLQQQGENDLGEFGIVASSHGGGAAAASTRRRLDSEATSQIPRSRSSTSRASSASRAPSASLEPVSSSSRIGTVVPRERRAPATATELDKRTPAATPLRTAQARVPSLSASSSRLSSSQRASADVSAASSSATVTASARRSLPKPGELSSSTSRRTSAPAQSAEPPSSSRSTRTLSSKMAIPTRVSKSAVGNAARPSSGATDSGRSSAASGTYVDDDEVRADDEMAAYVRRQWSKKVAAGTPEDTVRKMFEFPAPTDPLPPLSPDDAVSLYSRYLSPYERDEIAEYRQVYFVGPNCDKKPATKEVTTNNHGFDDERGDYLLVMHDHIQFRYEVVGVLGKGSFGQVLECRDHKTGDMVAVKIIRNKKRFHHQALVEIKVLENLVKWDPDEKHFVIRMVESFTFRGHLCIVTELLSINLYELVKANSFAGFSTVLIRRFAVQILGSLSLLRHHRVIHCDLKPENILLKHPAKSGIKVIDFGSSCFENEKVYTYIQSRFYRSPEVILGSNYTMAIDIWSLGCILAEMYTGYPIFPGENEQEQLACIMEIMGVPDKYLVDRSSRKRLFFDSTGAPRPVVNSKGRRRRPASKSLAAVLKCDDDLFVDFIAKCLAWDPERRLKPDQAMRHPFVAGSRAHAAPSTLPSRSSRSSAALTSSASSGRHASYGAGSGSSPSISTPMKKAAAPSSVSTAPTQRTRTMSSATATAIGTARYSTKASLPASSRYAKA